MIPCQPLNESPSARYVPKFVAKRQPCHQGPGTKGTKGVEGPTPHQQRLRASLLTLSLAFLSNFFSPTCNSTTSRLRTDRPQPLMRGLAIRITPTLRFLSTSRPIFQFDIPPRCRQFATMSDEATRSPAAAGDPKPKLHGRAFYESIGSPKFVVAPMVDQSEFVCSLPPSSRRRHSRTIGHDRER